MELGWLFAFVVLAISPTWGSLKGNDTNSGWEDDVWNGIQALDNFTKALKEKEFLDVLIMFEDTMAPCFVGWVAFFKMSMWFKNDEDVKVSDELGEMKEAYSRLNEELKLVEEDITAVKEEIDWNVVRVDLTSMESQIRRMGQKLAEVLHDSVDQEDGRNEYVRVYDDIYKSSGLSLYDSIVNNYDVYQENLLQAAIHYSKDHNFDDYLRGLTAILMRASAVEIAYEQFKADDRSMAAVWEARMMHVRRKMEDSLFDKRDTLLKELKSDIDSISSRTSSHQTFVNDAYSFLVEKYWWRSWFVMSYPYTITYSSQRHFDADPEATYSAQDYSRRSFLVCGTETHVYFNTTAARNAIQDKQCPDPVSSTCSSPAQDLSEMHPFHGVGKFVIGPKDFSYAMVATPGRFVSGHVNLNKTGTLYPLVMFYFG